MKTLCSVIIFFCVTLCNAQMLSPKQDATSRITFYALGTINGATENIVESITASGRLAVEGFILPNKLKINIGANLLNANPSSKIKKDSVDFNTLMFPETGNFGFLFNPSFKLTPYRKCANAEHSLWLDATYSFRKLAVDSPNVNFKINSLNVGIKYVWNYLPKQRDDSFQFSLMGYWNFFNIPDEDVKKFNTLITDTLFSKYNKNAEIHSIGLKATIQYKNFLFFADLRRNIKTREFDDDNPFKGTKFNIGFSTLLKLKTF